MDKILVSDIRLSVIAGGGASAADGGKHVAVHVSDAQAVKKNTGAGAFASLVQFAESILNLHEDADKVEVGWDEKAQHVTISPEDTADEIDEFLSASAGSYSKLVDEVKAQYQTIADLQAQVADAKKNSDAKAKTIADLQAQVAQLSKPSA